MTSTTTQARCAVLLLLPLCAAAGGGSSSFADGFESVEPEDIELHLWNVAGADLEGRDSPSAGLERAAVYLETCWEDAGLRPLKEGSYRLPFEHTLVRPAPKGCGLRLEAGEQGGQPRDFELGRDFVPLAGCEGQAEGELVFAGFGIDARKERYNDLQGSSLRGKIVIILEGEPRHKKRFDGPELSRYASLWSKLDDLGDERAAGVLVVRRAPLPQPGRPREIAAAEAPALGFRHTWASWMGVGRERVPSKLPPTLEISAECASALLGQDVLELAQGLDRTARARKIARTELSVSLSSRTERGQVSIDNVGAVVRGSDPQLAGEYVVVGAHYDHIGVDSRGRIGYGADDNGSGTAALLEVAQAMALAQPRRSVMFLAFAAEEDGMLGSAAFCERPSVDASSLVAMLNMDQIGRGEDDEVTVFGIESNPDLEDTLDEARKLRKTGVRKIVSKIPSGSAGLWKRSDHYSFHEIGVPALFFFEGLPISDNEDYHTWRDTIEEVDVGKVVHSARLVFNTAWLLANDDARPRAPRD